jgi:hypothetical protein
LITAFLDDLLAVATSALCTNLLSSAITDTLKKLGLYFHDHKCVLQATSTITHLGFKLVVNKQ